MSKFFTSLWIAVIVLNICENGMSMGLWKMSIDPNPLHASCKADWVIGVSCSAVVDGLKKQIYKWKGDDCGTSEKCKYTFLSFENGVMKAKHTTPVHDYVDDLQFTFKNASAQSCDVHGESSSETWYAVLDYGTNYCNLHNLITGAGFNETAGYTETTNDSICTQYSSANCEKY